MIIYLIEGEKESELEGLTFAACTNEALANKAIEMLAEKGFNEVVTNTIQTDVLISDGIIEHITV